MSHNPFDKSSAYAEQNSQEIVEKKAREEGFKTQVKKHVDDVIQEQDGNMIDTAEFKNQVYQAMVKESDDEIDQDATFREIGMALGLLKKQGLITKEPSANSFQVTL